MILHESLLLVLFIVSFIPSELGLTMYSLGLFSPGFPLFLMSTLFETGLSLSFLSFPLPSSDCWDFNLSTIADKDPFRFLVCPDAEEDLPPSPEAGGVEPPLCSD